MTDDTRKLLAGYATNTLTEAERKFLFEAALNDQELFDALHAEHALKDLLDDPVSRAQIRQALDEPHPVPSRAWWTRWWAWASAATAVAATVATVAVVTRQTVSPPASPPAIASVRPNPQPPPPAAPERDLEAPAAPSPRPRRLAPERVQNERKDQLALQAPPAAGLAGVRATPAAAPPPPPASFSAQQQVEVTPPAQQSQTQIVGGVPATSQDAKLEPLSFALLKRDNSGTYLPLPPNSELQPGDAVRINVVPDTSGYLSLSRETASGNWTLVYPKTGMGLPVNAKAPYTVPDVPIEVQDAAQKFRLTLVSGETNVLQTRSAFKTKTSALEKKQSPNAPLVLDFTISPRPPR